MSVGHAEPLRSAGNVFRSSAPLGPAAAHPCQPRAQAVERASLARPCRARLTVGDALCFNCALGCVKRQTSPIEL
jgi:hypothetical protein